MRHLIGVILLSIWLVVFPANAQANLWTMVKGIGEFIGKIFGPEDIPVHRTDRVVKRADKVVKGVSESESDIYTRSNGSPNIVRILEDNLLAKLVDEKSPSLQVKAIGDSVSLHASINLLGDDGKYRLLNPDYEPSFNPLDRTHRIGNGRHMIRVNQRDGYIVLKEAMGLFAPDFGQLVTKVNADGVNDFYFSVIAKSESISKAAKFNLSYRKRLRKLLDDIFKDSKKYIEYSKGIVNSDDFLIRLTRKEKVVLKVLKDGVISPADRHCMKSSLKETLLQAETLPRPYLEELYNWNAEDKIQGLAKKYAKRFGESLINKVNPELAKAIDLMSKVDIEDGTLEIDVAEVCGHAISVKMFGDKQPFFKGEDGKYVIAPNLNEFFTSKL
jgi:hypothetical protein